MKTKLCRAIKKYIKIILSLFFKLKYIKENIVIGENSLIFNTNIISKNFKKNNIIIGNNVTMKNCAFIFYGENNNIKIHNGAKLYNITFWFEDNCNEIIIGEKTTFHGNCQLAACEGTTISIGKECMFSHDIYIRTSDSHSIIKNNKRINTAKNINIGNHVWIGMQCLILKGANIPNGCIIGARSTISSSEMEANSIYVGSPAKIINKDIIWKRERI